MFKKWFVIHHEIFGRWTVQSRYFSSKPRNHKALVYWDGPYKTEQEAVSAYLALVKHPSVPLS